MFLRLKLQVGAARPVVDLVSDDLFADLALYGRLRIDLSFERAGGYLAASCPDRREFLVRSPVAPALLAPFLEGLRRSEGRLDLAVTDGTERVRLPRVGDLPHALDPTGDLDAWRDALVSGDPCGAAAALDRLERGDPRFPMLPLFRGETAEAAGDPDGALAAFRLELSARPANCLARAAAGRVLRANGRPAEAFAEYVEALRVHPCHVDSLIALTGLVDGIENLLPLLARLVRIDPGRADLDRVYVERERAFGGLTREQVFDRVRRIALATDPGAPVQLPLLARPGIPPADPLAGVLSPADILRYLLEEIMADGSLEAREREIVGAVREMFGVSAETYQGIARAADAAVRALPASRRTPLEETRLYRRVLDRALADGRISGPERSLLRRLGEALLITPEEHSRLLREALADRGYLV